MRRDGYSGLLSSKWLIFQVLNIYDMIYSDYCNWDFNGMWIWPKKMNLGDSNAGHSTFREPPGASYGNGWVVAWDENGMAGRRTLPWLKSPRTKFRGF